MVGYSEPCPCCGNKRRRPALERWDSSPASCSAAARSPPLVKFARSASAPSPSAVALATAAALATASPAIRATSPTPAPPAPLAPSSTSSDLPAPAPSENVPAAPPLSLPPDSRLDPTPPTTSIPAPAVAVASPQTAEAKQEVMEKKDEEGAKGLKEGEKERKEMTTICREVEVKVSFKCCKCGVSKAVVFPPTDSH